MSCVYDTNRYELTSFETHREWYLIQFAVNGSLTQSFWEHKSIRDQYSRESDFMDYLKRRALSMYEEFGDIRLQGPTREFRAHEAFA